MMPSGLKSIMKLEGPRGQDILWSYLLPLKAYLSLHKLNFFTVLLTSSFLFASKVEESNIQKVI